MYRFKYTSWSEIFNSCAYNNMTLKPQFSKPISKTLDQQDGSELCGVPDYGLCKYNLRLTS